MNNKSSRILVFSTAYLPHIGGAELALKEITDRVTGIDFDLLTVKLSSGLASQEKIGNINIYRLTGGKLFFPLKAFLRASKLGKYDVVFALQASYGAGGAWLYKLFNPRVKFILNIQEGKNLKRQGFLINFFRSMIINKADVTTVISNYLAEYVKNVKAEANIILIPNGVDLNKFKFSSSQTLENKTIITTSRLVTKNGIADLIDAFEILANNYKLNNANLLIIGSGPLEESLKFKVKSLNLEDRVVFQGEVPHDQLPRYLAKAYVYSRPSLSEGLGTAFLEAMACGVPVVCTARGGIVDFIIDRKTGLFCNAEDSKDLAEKISLLFEDSNLRTTISKEARKLVEEKYDWNKIAIEYQKIFT